MVGLFSRPSPPVLKYCGNGGSRVFEVERRLLAVPWFPARKLPLGPVKESKNMEKITREDVQQTLGEISPFIMESILDVGASRLELHEAAHVALMDYNGNHRVALSNCRVAALLEIIEGLLDEEDTMEVLIIED